MLAGSWIKMNERKTALLLLLLLILFDPILFKRTYHLAVSVEWLIWLASKMETLETYTHLDNRILINFTKQNNAASSLLACLNKLSVVQMSFKLQFTIKSSVVLCWFVKCSFPFRAFQIKQTSSSSFSFSLVLILRDFSHKQITNYCQILESKH